MKNVIRINKISKYLLSLVAVVTLGVGSQAFCMDIEQAIKEKSIDRVREILKDESFDVNKADTFGQTPLYLACWRNNLKIVALLLDNGAKESINKADNFGETPIYWACRKNNLEMVELLLKFGAKVSQEILNTTQKNIQCKSFDEGKKAIAKQILDKLKLVAEFPAQSQQYKDVMHKLVKLVDESRSSKLSNVAEETLGGGLKTDIFEAIRDRDVHRVKEILNDKSFDFNKTNKDGHTPLKLANEFLYRYKILSPKDLENSKNILESLKEFIKFDANKKMALIKEKNMDSEKEIIKCESFDFNKTNK